MMMMMMMMMMMVMIIIIIIIIMAAAATFYDSVLSLYTIVYPKFSGLAAWSENYKWYSSLPLDAVVSLFCQSV
jgi:hypothetical protein